MVETQIALLRGINVGGHNKIPMAGLKSLCEAMGWARIETYIQSGNLVFQSGLDSKQLESDLEKAILDRYGFDISVIVRPGTSWTKLVNQNPFPQASEREPNRVMMGLTKSPIDTGAAGALQKQAKNEERIRLAGDALWIHFPQGSGRTKITPALLNRLAGSAVTMRNWRTVTRIDQMAR